MKSLTPLVLGASLALSTGAQAGGDATPAGLDKTLSRYNWHPALMKIQNGGSRSIDQLNVRARVVSYLEYKGLYQAQNTPYCTDVTNEFHNAEFDSCYIGQPNQNTRLAEALKSAKVIALLEKSSPWDIANGGLDKPLNKELKHAKKYAEKCATEGNKFRACDYATMWKEMGDKLDALPKKK